MALPLRPLLLLLLLLCLEKNDTGTTFDLPFLTRLPKMLEARARRGQDDTTSAPTHAAKEAPQQATMPPLPLAAATAAAAYESEEERSLLFSDSDAEQEVSQSSS